MKINTKSLSIAIIMSIIDAIMMGLTKKYYLSGHKLKYVLADAKKSQISQIEINAFS